MTVLPNVTENSIKKFARERGPSWVLVNQQGKWLVQWRLRYMWSFSTFKIKLSKLSFTFESKIKSYREMVDFLQNCCSYLIQSEYGTVYLNVRNVLRTRSERWDCSFRNWVLGTIANIFNWIVRVFKLPR